MKSGEIGEGGAPADEFTPNILFFPFGATGVSSAVRCSSARKSDETASSSCVGATRPHMILTSEQRNYAASNQEAKSEESKRNGEIRSRNTEEEERKNRCTE